MSSLIDVHSHVVPLGVFPEEPRAPGVPWVRRVGDIAEVSLGPGTARRRVPSTSWDLEERLAWMDANGVDLQVLSPMPMLMAYSAAPSQAAELAMSVNAWIAEAVATEPTRFRGFGTVPLQELDLALGMLDGFAGAGLHGLQLGTNVAGLPVTDGSLQALWGAVELLDLPVLLHPVSPLAARWFPPGELTSHAAFPLEVGAAATALITSGTLVRHAGLRICATHGGGSMWSSLGRLAHFHDQRESVRSALPESPMETAGKLFVDCLTFSPPAVAAHCATVGAQTMMIGTDAPFIDDRPGWTVDEAGLSPADVRAIRYETAQTFLGLEPVT